ncbi:MAG: hypothetical protein CL792_06250 [Chloroflexi bacterium]|nr:hypothetical protein [Chloroflexota bacterium]|tara:strand:- start:5073 stop:6353 length:1281 start_codon:yes stop_codon:yes gene_type:complete
MKQFNTTEERIRNFVEIAQETLLRSLRTIRGTPGLFLLSLGLSAALWIFITEEENPTKIDELSRPLNVQAFNVEPGLAVANQLPSIEVVLAAPADRWEEIESGLGKFSAYVDLNGVTKREQAVRVHVETEGIRGVRVVGTIPETIIVNLEDLETIDIPVRVRPIGTTPFGYELGDISSTKNIVSVAGPASLINRVSDAVADINITGLTLPIEQTVNLVPRGSGGGEIRGVSIDPPSLGVTIDIQRSTLSRTLPLKVNITGDPSNGYRISDINVSPVAIAIEGTLSALQQLDSLTLDEVDVKGIRNNITKELPIELPEGVITLDPLEATVSVQVTAIQGSVSFGVSPQIVNLKSGLIATPQSLVVPITIYGPLPLLNTLSPDAVPINLDMAGFSAGIHKIEPTIILPPGVKVEPLQPILVSVILSAR